MPVNDHFNGFPIDFLTFTSENFSSANDTTYSFTRENLELENGYIGNSLYEKIEFGRKETTIVNCAVGQGKTNGILHSVKEFLNTEDSIDTYFIIAVPLVSLVTQYKRDLLELGFEEDQIFSYENISDNIPESGESYIDINCKIHIVTVNTLLGNAGEHAIIQSKRKYDYIKTFSTELSTYGKKLIVIYDEIHEAIRNFNETGIAHLSHFSSVLWKNILLSATYNVQSVPVIKLLAKQTNNSIRLLEAERVVTKPQSKLFLHFNNEYSSSNYTAITELILELIRREKSIDVLSFSKKLCKCLINPRQEPGRSLLEKYESVKDCTSDINNNEGDNDKDINENRFDNNYCNIGTNFKSGVNIKKENHAFVIILPPASARSTYASFNGIFSEGPNSVIQAIARQRTSGEIHIFLPKPIVMDYSSLPSSMSELQKTAFSEEFTRISVHVSDVPTTNNVEVKKTSYISFSKHIDEVDKWWKVLEERYEMPLNLKPELQSPSYDEFVIKYGEKCTTRTNFLGKDLASFVVYSAFTNQFFNARLESIYVPEVVTLENLQTHIDSIYDNLESSNISQTFANLERSIDLSGMTDSEKRRAKQTIFRFVINKQSNIEDIPESQINDAYRFLMSYFGRFRRENRSDLEEQIAYFQNLANQNLVERREIHLYKPYEQNSVFSTHVPLIRSVISNLKQIYPLHKDFCNFFDSYESSENLALEKKFYNFIIDITAHTTRRQTTVNGIPGYYLEVIGRY